MPRGKRQSDDGPPGPGAWIVTFSDCMTLLLCFFVLLLTFSSFEEVELRRLSGMFENRSYSSVFPNRREQKESLTPPVDRPIDPTAQGSEKPTRRQIDQTDKPREYDQFLDADAYKPRQTFRVPSERIFWGRGARISTEGTRHLARLARFLKRVPCRVVLAEGSNGPGSPVGLRRAWAVLDHLVKVEDLPRELFSLSGRTRLAPSPLETGPALEITFLREEAIQ